MMSAWHILSNKIRDACVWRTALPALLLRMRAVSGVSPAAAVELRGAGATFPAPLYAGMDRALPKGPP